MRERYKFSYGYFSRGDSEKLVAQIGACDIYIGNSWGSVIWGMDTSEYCAINRRWKRDAVIRKLNERWSMPHRDAIIAFLDMRGWLE